MEKELINRIQSFHGHLCPGLATGIQAANIKLRKIGGRDLCIPCFEKVEARRAVEI